MFTKESQRWYFFFKLAQVRQEEKQRILGSLNPVKQFRRAISSINNNNSSTTSPTASMTENYSSSSNNKQRLSLNYGELDDSVSLGSMSRTSSGFGSY